MDHSPADIVRHLIVQYGLGTMPWDQDDWPVSVGSELGTPDNTITVYDTAGVTEGATMQGECQEHHGIQVRVRAVNQKEGYAQASAVARALQEGVNGTVVTVEFAVYRVQALTRVSTIIHLSAKPEWQASDDEKMFEKGAQLGRRHIHTFNMLMAVTALGVVEEADVTLLEPSPVGTGTGNEVVFMNDFDTDTSGFEFFEE